MRKGLGRAVLYLREHDAAPYRDIILRAATEDLRHERQVEDIRSRYAVDLMESSDEPGFYRDAVLKALKQPTENQDEGLMVEVATILAEGGDADARQAVYDAYERHRDDETWTGVEEISLLDGVPGLLRALRGLSAVDWKDDAWFLSMLIEDTLEARMGKDETWRALDDAASGDARMARALRHVRAERENVRIRRATPGTPAPKVTFEELMEHLGRRAGRGPGVFRQWGRRAEDDNLRRAADALLAVTDPARRISLLQVFNPRPFPLDPAPLIVLVDSADWPTAQAALLAMEHVRHPDVRAYALRAIRDTRRASHAVDMLNVNFEDGDHPLIEWLAQQPEAEPDEEHWRDRGIEDFVRDHPYPSGARILALVYEKDPCGFCRYSIVKRLMALEALPDAIHAECRYDSYLDTRFLAEHGHPPRD